MADLVDLPEPAHLEGLSPFQLAHRRGCSVCRHPHRVAIEVAYVGWASVESIAGQVKLGPGIIRRHMSVMGFESARDSGLRTLLGRVAEQILAGLDLSGSSIKDLLGVVDRMETIAAREAQAASSAGVEHGDAGQIVLTYEQRIRSERTIAARGVHGLPPGSRKGHGGDQG